MNETHATAGLTVHPALRKFVEQELLTLLELDAGVFWRGLRRIVDEFGDENRALLGVRDELQRRLNDFHRDCTSERWDAQGYRRFLTEIGYLVEEGEAFEVDTGGVDREIAEVAGPQLVVPVNNARFALNAANARWGSLYDALYGTDVIPRSGGLAPGREYNPGRGEAVVARVNAFLDRHFPLAQGGHGDAVRYGVEQGARGGVLRVELGDGEFTSLADSAGFAGHREDGSARCFLLQHHGLHVEIRVDRSHPIGRDSKAGVCDVVLESAVTTIQDCEDSVAAVDAEDKVLVYRNWLGLMRGTLETRFEKDGRTTTRRLAADRSYLGPDGNEFSLPGRSLMLVRNVGHLMTTDAVLDAEGREIFEGMLDAVMTTACGMVDLRGLGRHRNSREGSIYIVKPKMHGPGEVAFANRLFTHVEKLFGLEPYTLKIGVMDEERRTTLNLQECIRAVRHRLVFINTGFLDRTGDEIHTSMIAGPMLPKEAIKEAAWIQAYEDHNVNVGIRCGLPGRAQIGKGMWPKPDEMRQMVDSKAAHCRAGANCAWVPSPTAATLHAMHYHEVDVFERQRELAGRQAAEMDDLLSPPFCPPGSLPPERVQQELDNNCQGILGYVVRWIDQGVGCSKVPDIEDVGLMEDRATLRISSQHIANWLYHGVCSEEQVLKTFRRMARMVDEQNAPDPAYRPMSAGFAESRAFRAACELALKGAAQPSGYTEPLLHYHRRRKKQAD